MKARRSVKREWSIHPSGKVRIVAGLALVALVAFGQPEMKAATCVVNPVVINNADGGAGSLRQAILDACDGSTITFANTVLSPITLSAELAIDKNLTIQGPGANALTISGNNAVRVFDIGSVNPAINVTLSGLTIANGKPNGIPHSLPFVGGGTGGGVYNGVGGTVTITNATIAGNLASIGGGIVTPLADPVATVNLRNTIVALNAATTGPDVNTLNGGSFTSQGHNLIGIGGVTGLTNGVSGDQVGSIASPLDPKLGPL